ncbi:hypothetical protein ANANG_G00034010 [Anguilla anguilla]|uniref:Uncharacterized protein n=1 Tax=Anguilla anguilla TaxID=7936 RepID=A0A9D3MUF8_ANGAN|nr:hypothetical protein ANANG_G00034010 [Anguilla anguilla]
MWTDEQKEVIRFWEADVCTLNVWSALPCVWCVFKNNSIRDQGTVEPVSAKYIKQNKLYAYDNPAVPEKKKNVKNCKSTFKRLNMYFFGNKNLLQSGMGLCCPK